MQPPKLRNLHVVGVALRLYEAFNLLASGGRWYSRMKRLAFTTNAHEARAIKVTPTCLFGTTLAARRTANQHALHIGRVC